MGGLILIILSLIGFTFLFMKSHLIETVKNNFIVSLKMQTEVKEPFNSGVMPKALTIEDLNNLARQFCERGQAIVIQCVERKITNPNAILSPFCQDVINHIQAGDDLTSDVQYLWGFLPNRQGYLKDLYLYSSTKILLSKEDLAPYLRYLWQRDISPVYTSYFWNIDLNQYLYHKPEDRKKPTPCAYTGVIIPP